jgi:hypothetical protein
VRFFTNNLLQTWRREIEELAMWRVTIDHHKRVTRLDHARTATPPLETEVAIIQWPVSGHGVASNPDPLP